MWAAIWAALIAIFKGVGAYLVYKFDPEMVKRRDELNKKAAEEVGHEKINEILADKNALGISFFISEFLRTKETNNPPGWARDLISRSLPKPRDEETRNQDTEDGPEIGE